MRAILSAPGSRGDVNPMIAIGRRLVQLGYEVVISVAEPFAELARASGLHAEPVISKKEFDETIGDAAFWSTLQGVLRIFRLAAHDFLRRHDEVIRRHHLPGESVLVAHPLDLASRVFRDAQPATALISVQFHPVMLRTPDDPPRLSPWWFECSSPRWLNRVTYTTLDHVVVDPILRGPVNRLRKSYGLAPVRRIMDRWFLSPDATMALYPEWFAPSTVGFANQLHHCGFPLDDLDQSDFELPDDGPIVFTFGTAHRHCGDAFERAAEACRQLKQPGLLLSSYPDNFPKALPSGVRTLGYASLGRLLPTCSAIVHHGGIGTTSQAFAAGIPQIVSPLAFDQFDNANRVERLRCGLWLRKAERLPDFLRQVLDQHGPVDRDALSDYSKRSAGIAGARVAADRIDQIAKTHSK